MRNVVFDIGNVLVRWNVHEAWAEDLGNLAAVEDFLTATDFQARNLRADRGEKFADLAREIADPADRALFASYPERFSLTIRDRIEGTWAIMERLKRKGHPTHAVTNWSAETWPTSLWLHPDLGRAFGVTVVSGQEKVLKPEARIFEILCQRAGVTAADCLFIDDSSKNVEGARAFGMDAIRFTTPEALEAELAERDLL